MSVVSCRVADSLFRPHPEQRARASREPKVCEYLQCVNLLLAIVFLNGGAKSTVLVACKSTSCEHHRTRFYHKGPKDPQK